MEPGTHNPQTSDVVSTCRIDDGVEALVVEHTYQKPMGDGRHWLLLNLPGRSSLSIYIGDNEDIANQLHSAALKVAIEAIRYERERAVQVIREESQRKVAQARVDNAPVTYTAGIEGAAVDFEMSLLEGRVIRG